MFVIPWLTQDVIWTSIQYFFERYGYQMDVKTTLRAYWVFAKAYLIEQKLWQLERVSERNTMCIVKYRKKEKKEWNEKNEVGAKNCELKMIDNYRTVFKEVLWLIKNAISNTRRRLFGGEQVFYVDTTIIWCFFMCVKRHRRAMMNYLSWNLSFFVWVHEAETRKSEKL